jgi:hypothetical protein
MGGKNHQPCRSYLVNSTKLSRAMSLAFVSLELANVSLEDVILAELDGKRGDARQILLQLKQSENNLQEMRSALDDLCQQMALESFQDLPTLKTSNLSTLGTLAKQEGLHRSEQDWNEAAAVMREHGFWGMTSTFKAKIAELGELTKALHARVTACLPLAEGGLLHMALEENGDANFKQEFARLYTEWASFQQLFLASSLISTELWYRFNKFGSLMGNTGNLQAAA